MVVKLILDSIQESVQNAAKTNAGVWLGRVVTSLQINALPITLAIMALAATIFCYSRCCNHAKNVKKPKKQQKGLDISKIPTPTTVPLPKPVESPLITPTLQPILIEEEKPAIKVRTIDDILLGVTYDTLEKDVLIVYSYLKQTILSSPQVLQKCYSIPLNILQKLEVSKLSKEDIYWLCFGKTEQQHQMYLEAKNYDQVAIQQTRFEALIGTDYDQLKPYFQNPYLTPYFSVKQLESIRSNPDFEVTFNKIRQKDLKLFFPTYLRAGKVLEIEQKRFSALFNADDVQSMLEEGALHFKSAIFDVSKGGESQDIIAFWKYHASLIPLDYIQKLDFSFDEEGFRINPAQITFMFSPLELNWPMEKLSVEQKGDIQKALQILIKAQDTASKMFLVKYTESISPIIQKFYT